MPYQQFKENWETFSKLVHDLPKANDEQINNLVRHYIEQNLIILNDVFSASIDNLNRLKNVNTANDVICTQARFANEVSKKLSLSTQRFLNASLGQIADYNEWLKAHCDLATD